MSAEIQVQSRPVVPELLEDEQPGPAVAPRGFAFDDIQDDITIRFQVLAYSHDWFEHVFRTELSDQVERFRDLIIAAGKGLRDEQKTKAEEPAFFQVWRQIVRRVVGYADADALAGADLYSFFEDPPVPEGASVRRVKIWRDMLRMHVRASVAGYLKSYGIKLEALE